MRKQKGFSLIELLIVVAIILIIAAIAIPNLLRSRMAANEASAVGSVRTINTGEVTYASTYPEIGFATGLSTLGGVAPCSPSTTTACIIDNVLATGSKSGYTLQASGLATAGSTINVNYVAMAAPITLGTTGTRAFCSDQSGVIYYSKAGTLASVGPNDSVCIGSPNLPLQ